MQIDHSKSIIEVDKVSFAYNGEDAIKDVSIAVHRGDYLGIIGPNGGGKSTLLKIMLGLLHPKEGVIKLFNQSIDEFKDWSKIGYVPQKPPNFELNFPVSVREVVAMGRYGKRGLLRFPTKEDGEKVNKALSQVEMTEFAGRQITELSGGQQQRVFIARALVSEPEVIFLDEPTAGVDIKTQKSFYALLEKLNRDFDLTLVLISHELDVLAHEATELAYINRTLEYYGDPKEFLKGDYYHQFIGKREPHH